MSEKVFFTALSVIGPLFNDAFRLKGEIPAYVLYFTKSGNKMIINALLHIRVLLHKSFFRGPFDFDRGMIVGARQAGVTIFDIADLLGFSNTTVCRVYSEWCENQNTSNGNALL